MEPKRAPLPSMELSVAEKESILRALGYYQIHLFDQISEKSTEELQSESEKVTSAIKKVHKTIEEETRKD
ncbi:MAG: hypothetical protein JRN52_00340 [Nitrososphaerota archaeon]|nr:hypothetical protein [Nitrososphaerota archaeon]